MIRFKHEQYICLKPDVTPDGIWGYMVKGYDITESGIILYSGNSNKEHKLDDLKEYSRLYISELIEKNGTN